MDSTRPTIASVLKDIENQQLVLPAIQREFVWAKPKICSLFDSLMVGYPMELPFWQVSNLTCRITRSNGFIKNYDNDHNNSCPRLGNRGSDSRFAILDGQQRLTSLTSAPRIPQGQARKQVVGQSGCLSEAVIVSRSSGNAPTEESGADEELAIPRIRSFVSYAMQVEVEILMRVDCRVTNHVSSGRRTAAGQSCDPSATFRRVDRGKRHVVVLDHVHLAVWPRKYCGFTPR